MACQIFNFVILCICLTLSYVTIADSYEYPNAFTEQVQNFPNVMRDQESCKPQKGPNTYPTYFICDPQSLLTSVEINSLNNMIYEMKEQINLGSGSCNVNRPRPIIGIALVNEMKGVGNIQVSEVMNLAAVFSYYVYDMWKLPNNCQTDSDKMIIFYSKQDGALYTYAGTLLSTLLPSKTIIKVAVESKPAFGSGVYTGLKFLLGRYKRIMTSASRSGLSSGK